VVIDGVGSARRGLKFEGYLRNKMGTVEVQDQIDGLTNLIKLGYVDTNRIAVYGWSYGGYLYGPKLTPRRSRSNPLMPMHLQDH